MKTRIIIPTLLAVALGAAACSPETIERSGDGNRPAIGFAAYETDDSAGGSGDDSRNGSTRGDRIDNAAGIAAKGGFDAWTYSHTGSWASPGSLTQIIDNDGGRTHVTSDDGFEWTYGATVLWPSMGKVVTSFGLAPHRPTGATVSVTPGSIPTVEYTVPPPGPQQQDLMFAEPKYNLTANSHGGDIPKIFHHALARLSVKAFKLDFMDDVVVTKITLRSLQNHGTAAMKTPVEWTLSGGGTTHEIPVANVEVGATSHTTADDLLSDAVGTLFVMPQPLVDDVQQLVISYTIGSGAPKERIIDLADATPGGVWQAGGSYTVVVGLVDIFYREFTSTGTWQLPAPGYYFIEAWGGDGGTGNGGGRPTQVGAGGTGLRQTGLFCFNGFETLNVQVGEAGGNASANNGMSGGSGGISGPGRWFGSGGTGGVGGNGRTRIGGQIPGGGGGGGGGAASGVLLGDPDALNIIIASGGGGGGGGQGGTNDTGGKGGNSGIRGNDAIPGPNDGGGGGVGIVANSMAGAIGDRGGHSADYSTVYRGRGGGGGGAGGGGWNGGSGGGGVQGHGGSPNQNNEDRSQAGGGGAGGASATATGSPYFISTTVPASPSFLQEGIGILYGLGRPTDRPSNISAGYVIITYLGPEE